MKEYPYIIISEEMIENAKNFISDVKVNRTIASKIDTLTGILGEFAFAQFMYGDWRKNNVGENKGEIDFDNIEIKTSAFPFRDTLNLLVREDYAKKRKPPFYVQIIIDVYSKQADSISTGTKAYISGWATHKDIENAPKRDFGSKLSRFGGYKCYYIMIKNLNKMATFKKELQKLTQENS